MAQSKKVLVVDDEPNMRRTLVDIFQDEGYEVGTAADGESAIAAYRENRFDVVLMDVRMPGMNGIEAFCRIRERNAAARVILMSGYGMDQMRLAALEAGAVAFLEKPLDIEMVIRLIEQTADTSVLVVENDIELGGEIATTLREHAYQVTIARTPHEVLELIEQIRFDIVLIDADLPIMSGMDLYQAIRKLKPTTIAVMITDNREERERVTQQAVSAAADAVIRKPVDRDYLLATLQRLRSELAASVLRKSNARGSSSVRS